MKGTIRWMQVNQNTNEFFYDLGQKDFDTSEKSMRDTIVDLLLHDWEDFGEAGDCLLIVGEENDEE